MALMYIGHGKNRQVVHWEKATRSRWALSLDLNVVTLVTPEIAGGGRELIRVGKSRKKTFHRKLTGKRGGLRERQCWRI